MKKVFKCLAVDDNPAALKLIALLINQSDDLTLIHTSSDPVETLKLIEEKKIAPDIIFLDLEMRRMHGTQFAERVIGSFIIAFLLFAVVRDITIKLDQNFDWKEQPVYRTGLQLFCGLMLPGFLAFLLAALYFRLRGVNILQTSYLRYDFQFILVQLLLINLYYAAYYFYARWLQAERLLHGITGHLSPDAARQVKGTFPVCKGARNLLLELDEIAYCYREGESVFLRTFSGEDFFISQSLDEVQQQLPETTFFRLNRQLLAHRQACKGFSLLSYGKLEAQLTPPYKSGVVISQKRSAAFKKWLEAVQLAF